MRLCIGTLLAAFCACAASALEIRFDYTYDTTGFFSGANETRRNTLELAASFFEARIKDEIPGISPAGSNRWTLSFLHPSISGETVELENPVLPPNEIVVYVGARQMSFVGYAHWAYRWPAGGSRAWGDALRARDSTNNFDPFGGSISFNPTHAYYFDGNPGTDEAFTGFDFYTVVLHELGHLLGVTAGANAFEALTVGETFQGPKAMEAYGAPVPLESTVNHLKEGLRFGGQEVAMDPTFNRGVRKRFTDLELAVLDDIGYTIGPVEDVQITAIRVDGSSLHLEWTAGEGPFRVVTNDLVDSRNWVVVRSIVYERSLTITMNDPIRFYRVIDLAKR